MSRFIRGSPSDVMSDMIGAVTLSDASKCITWIFIFFAVAAATIALGMGLGVMMARLFA